VPGVGAPDEVAASTTVTAWTPPAGDAPSALSESDAVVTRLPIVVSET
jgi:hypothetical protein